MANFHLPRNLRNLGRIVAADQVDRAIQRSCIGRIVSTLTSIFMISCLLIWILLYVLAQQSGLMDLLPDVAGTLLGILFLIGFIAAIIIAGVIGNLLRGRLWRYLRSRRS